MAIKIGAKCHIGQFNIGGIFIQIIRSMIDYTLEDLGDIVRISIPTTTSWGTILFAWEKSNTEFTTALESKGIDVLVNLLVNDPNTAYSIFIAQ